MMTEGSLTKPGNLKVKRLEIAAFPWSSFYDIKDLLTSFTIQESISLDTIRGTMTLLDSYGVLMGKGDYPVLRGEEALRFEVMDYSGVSRSYRFYVYKITDVTNVGVNGNSKMYKLHFVSHQRFLYSIRKIVSGYSGTISTLVKDILKDYYDSLLIEETANSFTGAVPGYTIPGFIDFLMRKAKSLNDSNFSTFRFFERGEHELCFATDEKLYRESIATAPTLTQTRALVGENEIGNKNNILTLVNKTNVDTMEHFYDGSYKNRVVELDLSKKTCVQHVFSIKPSDSTRNQTQYDTTTNNRPGTSYVNSEAYLDSMILNDSNYHQTKVYYKDTNDEHGNPHRDARFSTIPNEQHAATVAGFRSSYDSMLNSVMVDIVLNGRFDLATGHVVKLFLHDDTTTSNVKLSGEYLVVGVSHTTTTMLDFITSLSLVKSSFDSVRS